MSDNINKPHTSNGINISMHGHNSSERLIIGWPNVHEMADLAINHLNEICDPSLHYTPYVGGALAYSEPAFIHHRWDWVEVLPYVIIGRIAARRICGSDAGGDIEIRQRQLLLSSFHNLDGFAYPHYAKSWSEDTQLDLWEQSRVMFGLLAWFMESQDERLLGYVRGIVKGLMSLSSRENGIRQIDSPWDTNGAFGRLSTTAMVEPLMKYFEITGDTDALEICEGQIHRLFDPANAFTDSEYRISGFVRGASCAVSSAARYAAHVNDQHALDIVEGLFHTLLNLSSSYGATPEGEPCCTLMEMVTTALSLMDCGRGNWWDTIDRFFRNQITECQFKEWDQVRAGSVPGAPNPWDDTRDILKRSVGGFAWASAKERIYWPGHLMICCTGHAMWTLGKLCENAVRQVDGGIEVNLHLNFDHRLASIECREPYEGRILITPLNTGDVRVRKPSYAKGIRVYIGGVDVEYMSSDEYIVLPRIYAGQTIELSYDLSERTSDEKVYLPTQGDWFGEKNDPSLCHHVPTVWRGNTVIRLDYDYAKSERLPYEGPEDSLHRIYTRRMGLFTDGSKPSPTSFFLPDKPFVW
ncbi:MAG: hypothetical protein ACYC27_10615 [Armatimonadota bacterium]